MKTIERFFKWLKSMKFWKVFLLALAFLFVWSFLVGGTLYLCGVEFSQNVAPSEQFFVNSLFLVPFCAYIEEVMFRWIPMLVLSFILMWMYRSGRLNKERFFVVEKYAILILTIVSSVVFGWVHGNVFNVLIQGVSGTVFMLLYLRIFFIRRDKGLRNRWQLLSLAEAGLIHTSSNLVLMIL